MMTLFLRPPFFDIFSFFIFILFFLSLSFFLSSSRFSISTTTTYLYPPLSKVYLLILD